MPTVDRAIATYRPEIEELSKRNTELLRVYVKTILWDTARIGQEFTLRFNARLSQGLVKTPEYRMFMQAQRIFKEIHESLGPSDPEIPATPPAQGLLEDSQRALEDIQGLQKALETPETPTNDTGKS